MEPPTFSVWASTHTVPSPSWVLPLGLRSSNDLQQGGLGFWAGWLLKSSPKEAKGSLDSRHEIPEVPKAMEGRSSIEINPAGFTTCLASSFTHTPRSGNSWLPYTSASTFSTKKSKWLSMSTKVQIAKVNFILYISRPGVVSRDLYYQNMSYRLGGSCKIWIVEILFVSCCSIMFFWHRQLQARGGVCSPAASRGQTGVGVASSHLST